MVSAKDLGYQEGQALIVERKSNENLLAVLKEFNVTCPEELRAALKSYK